MRYTSSEAGKRRVFGVEVMRDKDTGKKKRVRSEAGAFTYTYSGTQSWKLATAYPVVENHSSYTRYLFKRTMKVNEPAG